MTRMPLVTAVVILAVVISLTGAGTGINLRRAHRADVRALQPRTLDTEEITAIMRRVRDRQLADLGPARSPRLEWFSSVLFTGVMAMWRATGDEACWDAAAEWAEGRQWDMGQRPRHADDHCAAQTYLELWFATGDDEALAAVSETFDALMADPRPGREDWSWCDALFMAPPAFARLGAATGKQEYLDFMDRMWWDAVDLLYDPEENLFYRDAEYRNRQCAPRPGESSDGKVFWGRGNGWVMAGVARVLEYMPDDYKSRADYERLLSDMASRIAGLQGDDGLWRTDLLARDEPRYRDTSSSALFCYALAWGMNEGVLDAESYLPVITRAWTALVDAVDESGKLCWVQSAATRPGPVGPGGSAAYAVGAFLLAGSELLRLEDGPSGPSAPLEVTAGSLSEHCRRVTSDGAWCWFADPRAVHHSGEHERTYVGWVTSTGDVTIASHDASTGDLESTVVGSHNWANDHGNPAILVLPDGRLMVFYCGHTGRSMWCHVSDNPEDTSSWGDPVSIETNTPGGCGYTYPNAVSLKEEDSRIYLFWRGGNFKPCFSTTQDGVTWSEARQLLEGEGTKMHPRPYVKLASDGLEKIHVAFTDGHPRDKETNNIYYACYCDGALHRADGSRIRALTELPMECMEADLVYCASTEGGADAWVWDVAVDDSGNPVIAYAVFPDVTDHRYRYARWNGVGWDDNEITPAGSWFPKAPEDSPRCERYYSGGVVLDSSDPSVVYLSRSTGDVHEIERWTTSDGGRTWSHEPVTSGSARDNVRPCVPRGRSKQGIEVLWMYGDYVDYADFSTELRMRERAGAQGS
jgi:rhamnogalacturonyl hydrolase YesR